MDLHELISRLSRMPAEATVTRLDLEAHWPDPAPGRFRMTLPAELGEHRERAEQLEFYLRELMGALDSALANGSDYPDHSVELTRTDIRTYLAELDEAQKGS